MGFFDRKPADQPALSSTPAPAAGGAARGVLPQLAEAREKLKAKDIAGAVAIYENVLASAGDRADVLVTLSGDLGASGHVKELIELANHHPRVNILQPGPGVGGHCIAVDPWFIVVAAPERSRLIRTAREVNDHKPEWVLERVKEAVAGQDAPTIALLGLAFKPNIDDLRESPARKIAATIADELPHASIQVVEPHVEALPKELANRRNVELVPLTDSFEDADCVVLLVDHTAFNAVPKPTKPVVVDTRGMWR